MAEATTKLALGEKASVFVDPKTKVKIVKGHFVEVPNSALRSSGKKTTAIQDALKGGQIRKVNSEDIEEEGLKEMPAKQSEQAEEAAGKGKKEVVEQKKTATKVDDDEDDEDEGEDDGDDLPGVDFDKMSKEEILQWANDADDSVVSPELYTELQGFSTVKDLRKRIKEALKPTN